ncbi:MAG: metallophosphoesterase family protein [Candidatus Omnitrophica bacterium]|nr:metallophosphoesterase family protein [Candidatus Omnitrophota bacterium]
MRYGIFADIHSNLEAYEAVLEAMRAERLDSYVCAGDIVGYGADISRCIELTKAITGNVICGNHDQASAGRLDTRYFNPGARGAVSWTAKRLNEAERQYLSDLKLTYDGADFTVVHGSLDEPDKYHYILDVNAALRNFQMMRKKLLFIGHTHRPIVYKRKGEDVSVTTDREVRLEKDSSYIVNAGSVGQPRDGDPRAAYVVYDNRENVIQIKRVSYDVKKAQEKILVAGLPPHMAERLGYGQ